MDHAINWSFLASIILVWNILDFACRIGAAETANIGSTFEFNCSVIAKRNENVTLQWNVDWWETSTNENTITTTCGEALRTNMPSDGSTTTRGQYTSVYEKSSINTTSDHHLCTVTVTEITQADAGSYGCTMVALAGNGSVSEENVEVAMVSELSVVYCSSTPVNPSIKVPPTAITPFGITFNFICNVSGSGRNIRWVDDSGETLESTDDGIEADSLQLWKRLRPVDNRRMFYCEVTFSSHDGDTDDSALCSVTPLRVEPKTCIDIGTNPVVTEGTSMSMTCTSNGDITRYEWYIGDNLIASDDTTFTIQTNFSESTLTIQNVLDKFNNANISCKAYYTDVDGTESVISTNSTVLQVRHDESAHFGSGSGSGDNSRPVMTWPTVLGIALCSTVVLTATILFIAFKRRADKTNNDDTEKIAKESPEADTDQQVKGYTKNTNTGGQINRISGFNQDRRPSLDYLDVSSGRRRSSVFRESFQDLWKGQGDGDDVSNASSVSLPSYAAVSQSTRNLDTFEQTSDELFSPSALSQKSHPPLSAQVSAPAAFTFNVNMNSGNVNDNNSEMIQMDVIKDGVIGGEDAECISDTQETQENGAPGPPQKHKTSTASNASNMPIPTLEITSPPQSPEAIENSTELK